MATNGEKYKTAEERGKAFNAYCHNQSCADCELDKFNERQESSCYFHWLDLESKEELKPCPFCGSSASLISGIEEHWILCPNKDCAAALVARCFASVEEATAAWNRRVS